MTTQSKMPVANVPDTTLQWKYGTNIKKASGHTKIESKRENQMSSDKLLSIAARVLCSILFVVHLRRT